MKKLEKKYGIHVLLQAFELLLRRYGTPVELLVVGEGAERDRLLSMRAASRSPDQISFLDPVPNSEVPGLLRSLDIFVVPSIYDSESFGVAAVEAGAVGLPVVVSDVGGLPEVVEHERSGLVVPREAPEDLAESIARLIENPEERVKFGAAGRLKVETEYDWNLNVANMIRIYESVLVRD